MRQGGDASVLPAQPWAEDGTALVTPIPPFPEMVPRNMPLDNRPPGNQTVSRSAYPLGLVIVPTGHEPTTTPAILPILSTSSSEYRITDDTYVDFPDGFVIWFLTQ